MNYKEYLKQLSIVILGILIAFWINNIGMKYNERNTQKQVLVTILNELTENNESISATIQNLNALQATFANAKSKSGEADTVNYQGIDIKSIGYESAKYTGVLKDLDYDMVSKIVENYESQNALKDLEKLLIGELFSFLKQPKTTDENVHYILIHVSNLKSNLQNFESEQKQLIEMLKDFLEAEP